jgi:uncharacterized protein YegP (UPF0339 family)
MSSQLALQTRRGRRALVCRLPRKREGTGVPFHNNLKEPRKWAGWFELSKSTDDQFRFVLKADNAQTILSSQQYAAQTRPKVASHRCRRTAPTTRGTSARPASDCRASSPEGCQPASHRHEPDVCERVFARQRHCQRHVPTAHRDRQGRHLTSSRRPSRCIVGSGGHPRAGRTATTPNAPSYGHPDEARGPERQGCSSCCARRGNWHWPNDV